METALVLLAWAVIVGVLLWLPPLIAGWLAPHTYEKDSRGHDANPND